MFRIEHSEKDPRECYLIDADSSVLLMERVEEDRRRENRKRKRKRGGSRTVKGRGDRID